LFGKGLKNVVTVTKYNLEVIWWVALKISRVRRNFLNTFLMAGLKNLVDSKTVNYSLLS